MNGSYRAFTFLTRLAPGLLTAGLWFTPCIAAEPQAGATAAKIAVVRAQDLVNDAFDAPAAGQFQNNSNKLMNYLDGEIRKYAGQNHIDLVLQDAAYAGDELDITPQILDLAYRRTATAHRLPDGLRIAFVDGTRLLEAAQARGLIEKDKTVALGNESLKRLARDNGIHLVLHEALFADKSIEITDQAIAAVQQQKPSAIVLPARTDRRQLGFIDTYRIMTESQIAKESSASLKAEFKPRENEMRDRDAAVRTKFHHDLEQRRNEQRALVFKQVSAIVKGLAKEKGLVLILQSAVNVDKDLDLTTQVLGLLNRQ